MSSRLILFFILIASAHLSFGIEPQSNSLEVVTLSRSQKVNLEQKRKQEEHQKLLRKAYNKLSDALAVDDLATVEKLFNTFPHLKSYAHHNEGTPLHFARSLAMAQLLGEKFGFDSNRCDEWGNLPSTTILSTQDHFFVDAHQKALIAHYLTSREKRFAKIYYQFKYNKNLQSTVCAYGLAALLIGLDCYFLIKKSQPLKRR